jgi:hypothetical protein
MELFSEAYERRGLDALTLVPSDTQTPKSVLQDPRWKALWRRPLLAEWQRHHDRMSRLGSQPYLKEKLSVIPASAKGDA